MRRKGTGTEKRETRKIEEEEEEEEEIEVAHAHASPHVKYALVLVGNVFDKDKVKGHRKKTRGQQRKRERREKVRF